MMRWLAVGILFSVPANSVILLRMWGSKYGNSFFSFSFFCFLGGIFLGEYYIHEKLIVSLLVWICRQKFFLIRNCKRKTQDPSQAVEKLL